MRVLTWNTNFRRDAAGQVAAVLAHAPDIVVLQEARKAGFEELRERFAVAGLEHFVSSHEESGTTTLGRYVVAASRFAITPAEPVACPAPEATVALTVDSREAGFELVGVYVPTVARTDGVKIPTQMAIHERMRASLERPHILCGDFNSPKAEGLDGTVTLFSRRGREAEFAGEHALMDGLKEFGLTDAFRACNGFEVDDRSWFWKNRGRTGGYRLDHIFVSRHFAVQNCWYDHTVREEGLSDHSIMAADVEFRSQENPEPRP